MVVISVGVVNHASAFGETFPLSVTSALGVIVTMWALGLQIYLLISFGNSMIHGERPRMIFNNKDASVESLRLPESSVKILIGGESDAVTAVGPTQISLFNFQSPPKAPVDVTVKWEECSMTKACNYNITVVHKMQDANQVFLCGTNGKETACCNMDISHHSATCTSSGKVSSINTRMRDFIIKEGEASALVESLDSADLYITNSGSQEYIGIRRFGKNSVRPAKYDKEQHYVEVVVSRQASINSVPQDKIYGFYNEKNKETDLYSAMWQPFVTRVCMTDIGGPKNNLQFTWTSQLNARLFCGDLNQKRHFSELVDVATVQADQWQNTRVYGLFRNEWGMSAVCVYTVQDIDHIFKTSPFKNSDSQRDRPRECVADSTKLHIETLKQIEANSEMEQCVQPVNSSGPLLSSHHHYTHIAVHHFIDKHNTNRTVLFLSLKSGAIHKIMHKQNGSEAITFMIAEYRPFNHSRHIVSLDLNPSTRKLYVTSRTEVVQLNVADCHQYGNTCGECVLARDPYCGWSKGQCTKDGPLQDLEHGNHAICPTSASKVYQVPRFAADVHSDDALDQISVPLRSRYFFKCPVSSHHAQYTWYLNNSPVSSCVAEQQCLLLISNMEPEQVGTYICKSEELGYSRVLAQYQLGVEDSARGYTSGILLWVCLVAALLGQS